MPEQMYKFSIQVTWEDGRTPVTFTKTTKWTYNQVRAWVCRKYPDSQYVYMNFL